MYTPLNQSTIIHDLTCKLSGSLKKVHDKVMKIVIFFLKITDPQHFLLVISSMVYLLTYAKKQMLLNKTSSQSVFFIFTTK